MNTTINFSEPAHVHFIGIGGISMSGLARVLLDRGFTISGSDNSRSPLTEELAAGGAIINYPQSAENITEDIDIIVYTAAIHEDNPEYVAAKASGKPLLARSVLLGQMMSHYPDSVAVAGTHGKTTTTSMLSQILMEADVDPTISVGGIFKAIASNIRVGHSDIFVTEACEYTNSFHDFFAKYSIILNIEEDHLDFFKDLEDIRRSFTKFASNTLPGGSVVINSAIPSYKEIVSESEKDSGTITFNTSKDSGADYTSDNITHDENGRASFTLYERGTALGDIRLNVAGEHNVSNALAAIAVSRQLGVSFDTIAAALGKFGGAGRRFEFKGEAFGAKIIDDYAHHPTEIDACIAAARELKPKRLIMAFQPHTYTRTKAFLDDFARVLSKADLVVLTDIYAAREQDIYGVSSADLARLIDNYGTSVEYTPTFDEAMKFLEKNLTNGDMLITCGAGNIVNLGENLLEA